MVFKIIRAVHSANCEISSNIPTQITAFKDGRYCYCKYVILLTDRAAVKTVSAWRV